MSKLFASALAGAALLVVFHGPCFGQALLSAPQRWGYQVLESTVVIDARPLAAEVLLDGRPLGLAAALIAQAISVEPGGHVIEVRAPGYRPYTSMFTADTHSSVTRFWVVLPPARQ